MPTLYLSFEPLLVFFRARGLHHLVDGVGGDPHQGHRVQMVPAVGPQLGGEFSIHLADLGGTTKDR